MPQGRGGPFQNPPDPPEYADRQTLWNAVEEVEPHPQAQLAYSFDIALQNEFSLEENIALARQFLLEQFFSRGMICDFSIHLSGKEDGGIANPHFHVMCPTRPLKEKVCPAALTTVVMSARGSSNYLPFMKDLLSGRWRQGASAQIKATSTAGSETLTVCSEASAKKSLD